MGGDGTGTDHVVLLADAARSASAWPDALVDGLEHGGRVVLRPDLPGQGRCAPLAARPTFDAVVDAVSADITIDIEGMAEPSHLVGWGFGGAVALAVAARRPELVGALTLVGTSAWVVEPALPGPDEMVAVQLLWRTRSGTAPEVLGRSLGRELVTLCGAADRHDPSTAQALARRWIDGGLQGEDGLRAAWMAAPPLLDAAEGLQVEVTVVHGAEDPLVPVAHGRRLAQLAGGRLVEVAGCGHELTPAMVAAVLAAVLDGAG